MDTFKIFRLIREAPEETLSSLETSLLMMMASIGNNNGKNINPGVKWLVEYTKLSKSSVIRSLASLTSKNVLVVVNDRRQGEHENTCYEINIELLEKIRSRRSHLNKNNPVELNLPKKVKIGENAPSISGVTQTPDEDEICSHLVSHRHQTGVTQTPDSGVTQTPSTNRPIIITNNYHSLVELPLDVTSPAVEKKSKKIPKTKKSWSSESLEIFEHWKKILNHPNAKFDKARKRKIEQALAEHGYTVEELKKAIEGNKKSVWHQGGNPGGVFHDSIGLIFRNPEKIETFLGFFDTQGAVKNNNATTGLKMSFVERNKSKVNMLDEIEAKCFPEFANRAKQRTEKENLLTFRQEREINGNE